VTRAPDSGSVNAESAAHPTSIVLRYYELVDADDVDALVRLFTPDATYHRPGYPPLVGRADLEHFYRDQRVIDSGSHQIEKIVAAGSEVAVYGDFTGTLRDGSTATLRFADFFSLSQDLLFQRRDTFFFAPLV
jgi:steroid Delta-isomerase